MGSPMNLRCDGESYNIRFCTKGGDSVKTMSRGRIEYLKKQYPPSTRVQLDRMGDDPRPIPAGTKGTVSFVDDCGTVFCNFDNGRSLGICPEVDSFHKISEQTETEDLSPKMSM